MQILADSQEVARMIDRLAAELRSTMSASKDPWAFVGVRSRGDQLARILADRLKPAHHGSIDIALYRDDLSGGAQPQVRTSDLDFPIDGTNIVLIDDVLMTGRSTRAAIQGLMDYGRPRCIRLMVLVDRGGRELPIAPDFVGLRYNADPDQLIHVRLKPGDDRDLIAIGRREEPAP